MSKETKIPEDKDNRSYLQPNPIMQKNKAQEALAQAKMLEAKQLAAGKKWVVSADGKTSYLKK